jgi:hypothetical protein
MIDMGGRETRRSRVRIPYMSWFFSHGKELEDIAKTEANLSSNPDQGDKISALLV